MTTPVLTEPRPAPVAEGGHQSDDGGRRPGLRADACHPHLGASGSSSRLVRADARPARQLVPHPGRAALTGLVVGHRRLRRVHARQLPRRAQSEGTAWHAAGARSTRSPSPSRRRSSRSPSPPSPPTPSPGSTSRAGSCCSSRRCRCWRSRPAGRPHPTPADLRRRRPPHDPGLDKTVTLVPDLNLDRRRRRRCGSPTPASPCRSPSSCCTTTSRQLPKDLFEAARIDGANHFKIFYRLVLPLSVPVLAAFAIFQFLWTWNDYLIAVTMIGANPDALPAR